MPRGTPRLWISALVLVASWSPAAAQSTRDEWLALRRVKEQEQALAAAAGPPPTRSNVITLLNLRFFGDASGRLVGVGEGRNASTVALTYARLGFVFYDAAGSYLGSEQAYLHGGRNKRVVVNGLHTNELAPGETGFFKVWTSVNAAAVATFTTASAGEGYATEFPASPVDFSLRDFPALAGQRYSGSLWQTPAGMARFSRTPSVAYFAQVAAASYEDGVVSDVMVTSVAGLPYVTSCGESTMSTVFTFADSPFAIDFERPVTSARSAIEFEETGVPVALSGFTFDWTGGSRSFSVARRCGWTAVPNVPWIHVTQGAASAAHGGTVVFTVDPSGELDAREAIISVSGIEVRVTQTPRCPISVSYFGGGAHFDPKLLMGSGGHTTSLSTFIFPCSQAVSARAPWLRINGQSSIVLVDGGIGVPTISGEPNTTTTSRRGLVLVGHIPIWVEQSPPSRDMDLNRDGWLDLLWQHQSTGRVAAWLMGGMTRIDGTLIGGTVQRFWRTDTNWKLVGAADIDQNGWLDLVWQHVLQGVLTFSSLLNTNIENERLFSPFIIGEPAWRIKAMADFNRDGSVDLVWQHEGHGGIAIWFMNGPTMRAGVPLGSGQVADLNWKIVGSGDFNRDGWQDLVWQHQGDGRIAVWIMRGATMISGDLMSPGQVFNLDWKIRGVGDINGDDMPDLIWQHRVTGDVSAWLMNGTTMMAGVPLGQVPDTGWQIVGPR